MTQATDLNFMRLAYEEALKATGNSDPNPAVGAIVVSESGVILARGFTQRTGYAHAERAALASLGATDLRTATLYVTLEPCCHHGRTPPCTEIILEKSVGRVVIAERDLAAEVMGRSVELLSAKNVEVELLPEQIFVEEKLLTTGPFFHARKQNRPRVVLKWAQTSDGALAPASGSSGKISGPKAAAVTAALRNYCKFTLATPGTVLVDSPRLGVRYPNSEIDWTNSGLTHFFARLLSEQLRMQGRDAAGTEFRVPGRGYLITEAKSDERLAMLNFQEGIGEGFELFEKPRSALHAEFAKTMNSVLDEILRKGHNTVLIEAGPGFSQSLIDAGFVDLIAVYQSKLHTATTLWRNPGRGNSLSKLIANQNGTGSPQMPGYVLLEAGDLDEDNFFLFQRQTNG